MAGALAAGADDVLYKPVDVTILVATVNKCVEVPGVSCSRPRRLVARAAPSATARRTRAKPTPNSSAR